MKYAADFRKIARNALYGKWKLAILVCVIALFVLVAATSVLFIIGLQDMCIVESVNSRSKVYYCPDNYTYAYQIFDKDGAVLEEKKDITGSVYIEELAEGIVHVAISAGSYARNDVFYDTEKGIKSEIFYNVAAICKRKVVYMDLCSQEGCLIVRDIFDKDLYYQEIYKDFSPSAVPSAVLQSAVFVEDNILEVIYLEGKDYTEKKERIEL